MKSNAKHQPFEIFDEQVITENGGKEYASMWVNPYGFKIRRACMSCVNHKVCGSEQSVKHVCRLKPADKCNVKRKGICSMWSVVPALARIGGPDVGMSDKVLTPAYVDFVHNNISELTLKYTEIYASRADAPGLNNYLKDTFKTLTGKEVYVNI